MKKNTLTLLIILTVIYNFIFWDEKPGVNFAIFIVLSCAAILYMNPGRLFNVRFWLLFITVIYSSLMIILNNSTFSIISTIISFGLFTGIAHQAEQKTIYSILCTSLSSYLLFPYNIFKEIRESRKRSKSFAAGYRIVKLAFIPVIIFFIFHTIYASANPAFNSYSVIVQNFLYEKLEYIFYNYPALRILFILSGFLIAMGFIFNRNITFFKNAEKQFLNTMFRDKAYKLYSRVSVKTNEPDNWHLKPFRFRLTSLLTEYRTGVILIVLVNLLLLALNIIDIRFTWFSFDPRAVDNMAYYVHDGTNLLIFSIVLSMLIILYYFRGNQNFYSKNHFLKYGAYMWLFQNAVMAVSLTLRNLYYIEYYYALSYKRIGVLIFISLVTAGLITMFIKLKDKKTIFWLLKVNGWAVFVMLLLISGFNWDKNIAEFNLKNPDKENIDYAYLIDLSPAVYPMLDKYQEHMNKEFKFKRFLMTKNLNGYLEYIKRKTNYLEKIRSYTWLSFNLPDYYMLKYYE